MKVWKIMLAEVLILAIMAFIFVKVLVPWLAGFFEKVEPPHVPTVTLPAPMSDVRYETGMYVTLPCDIVMIDREAIRIKPAVERGALGTLPAAHAKGAFVTCLP